MNGFTGALKYIFVILLIANVAVFFKQDTAVKSFKADIESYNAAISAEKVTAFNKALPEEKEIVNLISQLTKLGTNLNLTVPGIHYAPLKETNGYKNLSFTLAVIGDYEKIRRFIHGMETMRKFIYIEALTLKKAGESNDLIIELQVSTYFK